MLRKSDLSCVIIKHNKLAFTPRIYVFGNILKNNLDNPHRYL